MADPHLTEEIHSCTNDVDPLWRNTSRKPEMGKCSTCI